MMGQLLNFNFYSIDLIDFTVTELMSKGSLYDLLKKDKTLSPKRRMLMAKETAQGMNWLHTCMNPPVLHLDLKTSNILVFPVA